MKKTLRYLLSSFALISLISCNGQKTYTVTWKNDNTVLETDKKVNKGEMPEYNGETPTKEADETYLYEFSGWSPELTVVSKDITYVATFNSFHHYRVTFLNYDDSLLYETDVKEGTDAIYRGQTPTKEEDEIFIYEFDGWDQDLTNIQSNVTTKAKYKYTPIEEGWGPINW